MNDLERAMISSMGIVQDTCIELTENAFARFAVETIILSDHPDYGLESLNKSGSIKNLFPGLLPIIGFGGGKTGHKDLWAHTKQVVKQCPKDLVIRFAALYHDTGKPSSFRMTKHGATFHMHEIRSVEIFRHDSEISPIFVNKEENDRIAKLIRSLGQIESYDESWSDGALIRMHKEIAEEWKPTCLLAKADVTSARPGRRDVIAGKVDAMDERLKTLLRAAEKQAAMKLPKGLGQVIERTLGIKPGREMGALIKRLQHDVERGEIGVYSDPNDYVGWFVEQASGTS